MRADKYKPVGNITTDALRAAIARGEFTVTKWQQVSKCTVKLFTTGPVDYTIKTKTLQMMMRTGELK